MTLMGKTDVGEPVALVAFDGNLLTVHSERPYAPGQPMRVTVPIEPECLVEGRTTGTKRLSSGPFEVRLRLISLTREDRERLREAVGLATCVS